MTLAARIATDATTVFLNTDHFAETVTYYKRDSTTTRSIVANVEREILQAVSEHGGESLLPMFEVSVANSSTSGIASTEINLGGDQIGLEVRPGLTATRRTITRIVSQDDGILVLECR